MNTFHLDTLVHGGKGVKQVKQVKHCTHAPREKSASDVNVLASDLPVEVC